jgi:FkbM family methyltransferase
LFKELTENAKLSDAASAAAVELFDVALSSENGSAMLDQGEDWNTNRGVARVLSPTESQQARSFKIQLRALDSILPPDTKVGLCKLDVERHELQVLSGALGLLRRRQIRDVLFEDFGPYPGEAQQLLQSYGFSIFSLHLTLLKPEIRPLAPGTTFRRPYEGCDFIATLDPERTKKRFASFGWTALKARH